MGEGLTVGGAERVGMAGMVDALVVGMVMVMVMVEVKGLGVKVADTVVEVGAIVVDMVVVVAAEAWSVIIAEEWVI